MVSAIIASGGSGSRLGQPEGKQLLELHGRPVISYSIETIAPFVDEIILVIRPEDVAKAKDLFCHSELKTQNFRHRRMHLWRTKLKIDKVVAGGETRTDSVRNALDAVSPDCDIVLIHDGARPFVSADIVEQSINAAKEHGAAVVAVPLKDTIKKTAIRDTRYEIRTVKETLNRSALWAAQTPQTFQYAILKEAYSSPITDHRSPITDDASLVEALGHKVVIVNGDDRNFKITTESDLNYAEYLLR